MYKIIFPSKILSLKEGLKRLFKAYRIKKIYIKEYKNIIKIILNLILTSNPMLLNDYKKFIKKSKSMNNLIFINNIK